MSEYNIIQVLFVTWNSRHGILEMESAFLTWNSRQGILDMEFEIFVEFLQGRHGILFLMKMYYL